MRLKHELDKKEMRIEEIVAEMELCGFKLKNYEEEEGQYKETIG
jgi:hypothetical protein